MHVQFLALFVAHGEGDVVAGVFERMGGDVGGLGGVYEDLGCEDGAAGVSCALLMLMFVVCM